VRSSDFFIEEHDPLGQHAGAVTLDVGLLESLRKRPLDDVSDVSAALGLLDLVQEELEAYGTAGGQQLTDRQIALATRTLKLVTGRVGAPLELPFHNFTTFRSYWIRNGASGSGGWQARRDILDELVEPTRRQLLRLQELPAGPHLHDHAIARLRDPAAIQEHTSPVSSGRSWSMTRRYSSAVPRS
jgi:hypothetical protein